MLWIPIQISAFVHSHTVQYSFYYSCTIVFFLSQFSLDFFLNRFFHYLTDLDCLLNGVKLMFYSTSATHLFVGQSARHDQSIADGALSMEERHDNRSQITTYIKHIKSRKLYAKAYSYNWLSFSSPSIKSYRRRYFKGNEFW